jgi:beta-lactamase regulating signal transducer with metallopeptidase domain
MTEAVAYALFCSFVLSAVLVPPTALAMRRAAGLRGETRHAIWFMILLATVATTVAPLVVSALRRVRPSPETGVWAAAPPSGAVHAALPLAELGAVVLAVWLVVSIALLFRIARRVAALRAVKRRATPLALDDRLPRRARVLTSEFGVAAAVGYLHPAILLPSGTMQSLDSSAARHVVLHEAAHLRRGDDLTGLVFLLCAAVLWFNPFVHYIGKKLSLECEIACDEIVVDQTGDAARYAALLFEMAETMTERRSRLAWNGFAHANGLVTRIHNLLHRPHARRAAPPRPALAVFAAVLLSSAGLAAYGAPALARDDTARWTAAQWSASWHVRDFPACKAAGPPSARRRGTAVKADDTKFCAWEPMMRWEARSRNRVKKSSATP